MYLTYNKSLPSFYQELVQLEMDVPDASKVYVGFQEGFVPLAAKYYEALMAPVSEEVIEAPVVEEAPIEEEEAPVEEPIAEEVISEEAPVEEVISEESISEEAAPVVKRTRRTASV